MPDCNVVFSGLGLQRAIVDQENQFKISITDKTTRQPLYPPDVSIRITSLDETEVVSVSAIIGDDDQFLISYTPHREGDYIIELLQKGIRFGHDQPHCVYAQLKTGDQPDPSRLSVKDDEDEEEEISPRRAVPRDQSANFKFTDFTGQGLKKVTRRKEEKKVKVLLGDDKVLKFVVEDDRGNRIRIPKDKLRVLVTPVGAATQLVNSEVDNDSEISLPYPEHPDGAIIEIFQDEMLIETLRVPGQQAYAKSTDDSKLSVALDPRSLKLALSPDSANSKGGIRFSFEDEQGKIVFVDPNKVKVIIKPPNSQPFTALASPDPIKKAFNVDYHGLLDGCEIEIYEAEQLIETFRIPKMKDTATLNNFLAILGYEDTLDADETETIEERRPRHAELLSPAGAANTKVALKDHKGTVSSVPSDKIKIKVRPPNAEPFICHEKVTYDNEGNLVINNLVVFEDYEIEILADEETVDKMVVPKKIDFNLILDPAILGRVVKGEAENLVFQATDKDGNYLLTTSVNKIKTRITQEGTPPFEAYAKHEDEGRFVLDNKFHPLDGCEIDILEGDEVIDTFRLKLPDSNNRFDPSTAKRGRNYPALMEFPPPFETKKKGVSLEVITHYPRKTRRFGDTYDVFVIIRDKKTKVRHNEFEDIIKCYIKGPTKHHVIHKSSGKLTVVNAKRTTVDGQYIMQFKPTEPGKYKCMVKFEDQKVQWKKTVLVVTKKKEKEEKEKEKDKKEKEKEKKVDTPPISKKGPNPGEIELELNSMTMRRQPKPNQHKPNPFAASAPNASTNPTF